MISSWRNNKQIKRIFFHSIFYFSWSSRFFLIHSKSAWILSSWTLISVISIVFLNSSRFFTLEFNVARTTQSQKTNETVEMIVCGCKIRVWMSILFFYQNKILFNKSFFNNQSFNYQLWYWNARSSCCNW